MEQGDSKQTNVQNGSPENQQSQVDQVQINHQESQSASHSSQPNVQSSPVSDDRSLQSQATNAPQGFPFAQSMPQNYQGYPVPAYGHPGGQPHYYYPQQGYQPMMMPAALYGHPGYMPPSVINSSQINVTNQVQTEVKTQMTVQSAFEVQQALAKASNPDGRGWILLVCLVSITVNLIIFLTLIPEEYYQAEIQIFIKNYGGYRQLRDESEGCFYFLIGNLSAGIVAVVYTVWKILMVLFTKCNISTCACCLFIESLFLLIDLGFIFMTTTKKDQCNLISLAIINDGFIIFPENPIYMYIAMACCSSACMVACYIYTQNRHKAEMQHKSLQSAILPK